MRVQALERRAPALRPRDSSSQRRAAIGARAARVERARSAATRASARRRLWRRPGRAASSRSKRRDAAARLELADGAHEHAAGEPERRRERLAAPRRRAAGRSRSGRRARSAPQPRRAHAAAARAGARSPRGHAPSPVPRPEVWQPGGAPAQTAKRCACRCRPRPRPARSARLHRARRLGAVALLLLLVVLCVGPVRSYLHARSGHAAAAHRGRRSSTGEHAKLQAELRSASQTHGADRPGARRGLHPPRREAVLAHAVELRPVRASARGSCSSRPGG